MKKKRKGKKDLLFFSSANLSRLVFFHVSRENGPSHVFKCVQSNSRDLICTKLLYTQSLKGIFETKIRKEIVILFFTGESLLSLSREKYRMKKEEEISFFLPPQGNSIKRRKKKTKKKTLRV